MGSGVTMYIKQTSPYLTFTYIFLVIHF